MTRQSAVYFDGFGNTMKIISELAGYTDSAGAIGAPACEACANYSFPNGLAGYLPATGELRMVSLNKNGNEVNKALTACGGQVFTSARWHWASVPFSDVGAYVISAYGDQTSDLRSSLSWVRPFCKI